MNTLLNFPDSRETFDLVESLGGEKERAYWVKRPRWFRCKDNESIVHAIKKLKENGRGIDALVLAAQQWKVKDPVIVFDLLDQAIEELNNSKKRLWEMTVTG